MSMNPSRDVATVPSRLVAMYAMTSRTGDIAGSVAKNGAAEPLGLTARGRDLEQGRSGTRRRTIDDEASIPRPGQAAVQHRLDSPCAATRHRRR